jgi:ribosomal protein S27AE
MVEGLIWQEFLKTDQRRRFMPCPHCAKPVVLAWSKSYTTFKLSGCEAFATWDKEAKRKDGSWDLDRVEQSARFECPHCGGHIKDGHKSRMDRAGEWKPTTIAARGYRGWHLSSLYASSPETSVGRLARKFLMAKNSLNGLQGFINGDLAEPYQSQDTMQERIELVTASAEIKADQQKLMTVDCQEGSPHFWFAIRNWSATETIGIQAGAADTWEELRSIQTAQKIPDVGVIVDSGFGARSDADVYVNCARFADWFTQANGRRLAMGWMPAKGMPGRKRWHHKKTGNSLPWFLGTVDPFTGSAHAGDCSMNLLEFSGDFFKDILATLRSGKQTPKWSISDELNRTIGEEYWRHMDAEVKTGVFNRLSGTTRYEWRARSKSWPNHLLDCEVMQLVGACFFGILQLETLAEKKDGR